MIKRLIIYVSMVNCIGVSYGQTISLVDNQTASVLSNLLAGKGIQVSGGFTLNCNSSANGTFVNVNPTPNLSLAIDSGVVLCTGRVLSTAADTGINASRFRLASNNWGITTTDAQIATIAGASATQRDLCFLQFNFIPRGDSAFIDYVFASEDYPEYAFLCRLQVIHLRTILKCQARILMYLSIVSMIQASKLELQIIRLTAKDRVQALHLYNSILLI